MQEKLVYDNRVKRKNILALNEKIAAIRYYETNPSYKSVGRHFNCSPDQIKRIIQQKEEIIKAWSMRTRKPNEMGQQQIKSVQVSILGKAVHEWIRRMMYYKDFIITDGLIQKMALQFKSVLGIRTFFPTTHWVDNFRVSYKVNENDTKKLTFGHTEGYSVQLSDIIRDLVNECPAYVAEAVDYVSNKATTTKNLAPTSTAMQTETITTKATTTKATLTTTATATLPVRTATMAVPVTMPVAQIRTVTPLSAGAGIRHPFTMTIIPMASVPSALLQELPAQARGAPKTADVTQKTQASFPIPIETSVKQEIEIKSEVISDDEAESSPAMEPVASFEKPELMETSTKERRLSEELPLAEEPTVVIRTVAEARKCLKLLEDFSLLKENFRLIGLLTRADEVLQEMDGNDDDVDIG